MVTNPAHTLKPVLPRFYQKLSGMTGTAKSAAAEFYEIYALRVVPIPTNKPPSRTDLPLRLYYTEKVGRIQQSTTQGRSCTLLLYTQQPCVQARALAERRSGNAKLLRQLLHPCWCCAFCPVFPLDVLLHTNPRRVDRHHAANPPAVLLHTNPRRVTTDTTRYRTSWRTSCLLLSSAGVQGGRC